MGFDIEKEMKDLRDSVNSGLFDDKLSSLVGEVRAKGTAARQALADEDVERLAAAGSGDILKNIIKNAKVVWNNMPPIGSDIMGLGNGGTSVSDLQNQIGNGMELGDNDTIEVQEFF